MIIKGINAAKGFEQGKAFKLEKIDFNIQERLIINIDDELTKLNNAIIKSDEEIKKIYDISVQKLGIDTAQVFQAHLLILKDEEMLKQIRDMIKEKISAEYSVFSIRNNFIKIFENMKYEYMKDRALDIKDVTNRLLAHLTNKKIQDLTLIEEEVILIANDLTPSDTAQLDKKYIKGFITEIGGKTSHTAIMSRSLEIPAIVGAKNALNLINDGDLILLDGSNGEIIINPTQLDHEEFIKKQVVYENKLFEYINKETYTKNGNKVELVCNIGNLDDLKSVISNGAEGIGLFRTEFLFMERNNFPSEDDQFIVYKSVLEKMENKPVVIRTLDIGGDKELSYLNIQKELNPFLGVRAIRLCLNKIEIFKTQLRALLRASSFGNLKIMFPMIATLNELREVKSILSELKEELISSGIHIGDYEVGMMMEVPSAAIIADLFAEEVDFLSIGTNDLIQYTMAADRMNEGVSYLYQPFNPAVIRLIKNIIDASHENGIWTGMCGEMASDINAIPLLIGLGIDELSVSASLVLEVRETISKIDSDRLKNLIDNALKLSTAEEVEELFKKRY
ncbi:phosphoenolpyruvate--protein phosphotransferase [Mycoplasmatota bacterium WC44]